MPPPAGTAEPATPASPSATEPSAADGAARWTVPPELIPNLDELVIEDGAPVDSIFSEKEMRLLTEPLYTSWAGPGPGRPFTVLADVGLFTTSAQPTVVPDVMLSLDVAWPQNLQLRENLSYFVWIRGKLPEVAIEVVSNREGGEDTRKLREYERIRIPYYVIFDPENQLGGGVVRVFELRGLAYQPLSPPWWLGAVGLGLTLWEGVYEDMTATWLRWCDRDGVVIPTGAESAERARREADQAKNEAGQAKQALDQLRAHMRSLGLEPPV